MDHQFTEYAQKIVRLYEQGDHEPMMSVLEVYNAHAGNTHSVWVRLRDLCNNKDQYAAIVILYHIRKEMQQAKGTHVCEMRLKGKFLGSVIVTAKNGRLAHQYAANAARELQYAVGVRIEVKKIKPA